MQIVRQRLNNRIQRLRTEITGFPSAIRCVDIVDPVRIGGYTAHAEGKRRFAAAVRKVVMVEVPDLYRPRLACRQRDCLLVTDLEPDFLFVVSADAPLTEPVYIAVLGNGLDLCPRAVIQRDDRIGNVVPVLRLYTVDAPDRPFARSRNVGERQRVVACGGVRQRTAVEQFFTRQGQFDILQAVQIEHNDGHSIRPRERRKIERHVVVRGVG